ncbi:uncharacterized protein AB675_3712 [Cyphellophora attinorum]|uniref:Heterokaryon incompatibility domain-containing protein n=1 Tax=Cyphellophora attinorum TaxID=1664694 RepID=A0A0N1H6P9_9EURO|nr:uncharacterized protein AB675_3712 [Phialophora attinorum]KPI37090.1 hypothetical protein AB675_3712 [Phialophora attinorum]
MNARYEHVPLPLNPHKPFFRLLKVQRGRRDEPLAGQLDNVAIPSLCGPAGLVDKVYYKALSYVWGLDIADCEILIDGRPLSVHRNLHEFLLQWRQSGFSGYLWIDAICINQSDLDERAAQVRYMPQIYREATKVIVWLGPGSAITKDAMKLLETVSHSSHEFLLDHYDAKTLSSFDSHAYWRRTWVVQEFCLARRYTVMWGDLEVADATLDRFRSKVTGALALKTGVAVSARYRFEWRDFGQGLFRAMQQRSIFDKRGRVELLKLICAHKWTMCRHPQDRVFAMLGLAKEKIAEQIQIDYTQTMESLLVHVLKASVVASDELARWIKILSIPFDVDPKSGTRKALSRSSAHHNDIVGAIVASADSPQRLPDQSTTNSHPTHRHVAPIGLQLMEMTAFVTGHIQTVIALEGRMPSSIVSSEWYYSPKSRRPLLDGVHMSSLVLPDARLARQHLLAESVADARPSASIVAVDTDLKSWSSAHGVAFGHPRPGNLVAHFLGHETALTLDVSAYKANKPCITGRLRCPRTSVRTAQDPVTGVWRPEYEWFPFSESDCESPSVGVRKVELLLTPMEVLHLGCDPKVFERRKWEVAAADHPGSTTKPLAQDE